MMSGDPAGMMGNCRPAQDDAPIAEILRKEDASDGAKGSGDAVGLKSQQKRTVHVSTHARVRPDRLTELVVQCIQPAGSRFVMLCDDSIDRGGQGRAPDPLTYLSCGVAFCYMTQIGRYAQIVKQKLHDYRVVQDTAFGYGPEEPPMAAAVETLVCLDTDESPADSIKLVRMGEQTCYIHGAYRLPTEVLLNVIGQGG